MPYHWQYTDAGEWKSLNEKDNEKLEKLYCDVKLEECSATGMQISHERYVIGIIVYTENVVKLTDFHSFIVIIIMRS